MIPGVKISRFLPHSHFLVSKITISGASVAIQQASSSSSDVPQSSDARQIEMSIAREFNHCSDGENRLLLPRGLRVKWHPDCNKGNEAVVTQGFQIVDGMSQRKQKYKLVAKASLL